MGSTLLPPLLLLTILLSLSQTPSAAAPPKSFTTTTLLRRSLEEAPPLRHPRLSCHGGRILSGKQLQLHVLWYGNFPESQQSAVYDFIASFNAKKIPSPSVASWWEKTICLYKDSRNDDPPPVLKLGAVASDCAYSAGKSLNRSALPEIIEAAVSSGALPPTPPHAMYSVIYAIFTAADVMVQDLCMSSCGTHATATCNAGTTVAFLWVGSPAQCPGMCAWPYAVGADGPRNMTALTAPNGDAATDGMIINLAALLAGTVTNPFGMGFFPSGLSNPAGMEAATSCTGIYGKNSYPGYPGDLRRNKTSGARYNARGIRHREFLLPAIWSPKSMACEPPS